MCLFMKLCHLWNTDQQYCVNRKVTLDCFMTWFNSFHTFVYFIPAFFSRLSSLLPSVLRQKFMICYFAQAWPYGVRISSFPKVEICYGTHTVTCSMGAGFWPRRQSRWGVKLTTRLNLVSRFYMRSFTSAPHAPSWRRQNFKYLLFTCTWRM